MENDYGISFWPFQSCFLADLVFFSFQLSYVFGRAFFLTDIINAVVFPVGWTLSLTCAKWPLSVASIRKMCRYRLLPRLFWLQPIIVLIKVDQGDANVDKNYALSRQLRVPTLKTSAHRIFDTLSLESAQVQTSLLAYELEYMNHFHWLTFPFYDPNIPTADLHDT